MRRSSRVVVIAGAILAGGAATAQDLEIVPVRGPIYLLSGAGANITLSVGKDGVFMVDSGTAQMSEKVLAAIDRLSREIATAGQPRKSYAPPKPVRYIANTSALPDHVGGN